MAQRSYEQQQMLLAQETYPFLPPSNQLPQNAILDSTEQGFIENFFNNPEHAVSQQGLGDEASLLNLDGLYNPFNFASEASLQGPSSHAASRSLMIDATGGQVPFLSAADQWLMAPNDVANAASALAGFHSSTTNSVDYNGSWSQGAGMAAGYQDPRPAGQHQQRGVPQYPFANVNLPAPPTWQHLAGSRQTLTNGADRTRLGSLDAAAHSFAHPHMAQVGSRSVVIDLQGRPSTVRFGSDNNFSDRGYQAPAYKAAFQDRSSDLLNIPFAAQVADNSTGFPQNGAQRATNGIASQVADGTSASRPGTAQQNGAPWEDSRPPMHPEAEDRDEVHNEQPRKRHKTRPEQDERVTETKAKASASASRKQAKADPDEEAYEPVATGSAKRRKSIHVRAASPKSPPSSDDEADATEQPSTSKKKDKKPRQNLSDVQKRQNHIMSEKKRRELIKTGYADLNKLVPSLVGGKTGMSRSESLFECHTYLEGLVNGSKKIMDLLKLNDEERKSLTGGDED